MLPKLSMNVTNTYIKNLPGMVNGGQRFAETAGAVSKRKKKLSMHENGGDSIPARDISSPMKEIIEAQSRQRNTHTSQKS